MLILWRWSGKQQRWAFHYDRSSWAWQKSDSSPPGEMALWPNSGFSPLHTGTYNSKYIWCGSDILSHHTAVLCPVTHCNRRMHWHDKLPALIKVYRNRCAFSWGGKLPAHPEVCKQKIVLQINVRQACFVLPLLSWFSSTSSQISHLAHGCHSTMWSDCHCFQCVSRLRQLLCPVGSNKLKTCPQWKWDLFYLRLY